MEANEKEKSGRRWLSTQLSPSCLTAGKRGRKRVMGASLTICLLQAVLMEQKCVQIIGLGERGRAAQEPQPLTWWKPNGNNCRCFDRAYMIVHNKHPVFFRSNLHQIAVLCWNRLFRCPPFGCRHFTLWFTQSKLSFFLSQINRAVPRLWKAWQV